MPENDPFLLTKCGSSYTNLKWHKVLENTEYWPNTHYSL